jgi:hypothetical protein
MNLRRVLRKPFTVLLALETLLVAGLGAVAWEVWHSRQEPPRSASTPSVALPRQTGQRPPPASPGPSTPPTPGPSPGAAGPAPGYRSDAGFLARQLRDVNRDQAALENVEWRLVKAAMQGMKGYIEKVVVPAMERAERGGR